MKTHRSLTRFISIVCALCAAAAAHCQVNTWVFKAHMITARTIFAATLGPDGKIYVFGGQDAVTGLSLTSAEVYDPALDTWSPIADMPKPREACSAVTGQDGKIYIFGGIAFTSGGTDGSSETTAMTYDPTTNTYSAIADIPYGFNPNVSAMGNDGNIYLIAGQGSSNPLISYFYEPLTDMWSQQNIVPSIPGIQMMCQGNNGLIYLVGGQDSSGIVDNVESFDAHTNDWSTLNPMGTARLYPCVAEGADNRIYVMGGFDPSDNQLKTAEAYDIAGNSWSPIADLHSQRVDACAVAGPDGKIYVIGGLIGANITNTVECYQPSLLKSEGTKLESQEGQDYNGLIGRFSDLDTTQSALDFTASIDWGDGTPHDVATIVPDVAPGTFKIMGDHTYAEANGYTIQINLQDSDGEADTLSTHMVVDDAPLTGSASNFTPSVNILYSGAVATLSDGNPLASASDYTGTIDWGDGASDTAVFVNTGPGTFNISGSHTYANQGAYQVKVAVNDTEGSTLSLTGSATVMIPAPHVVAKVVKAVEGALFNGPVAFFSDDSPNVSASSFSATINWGDGTTSAGNVVSNGSGGFNVTGNHLYAEEGLYSTTVTVAVVSGGSVSATGTALVADAPITATGYTLTSKTTSFSDTVASFTDADPAGVISDYTAGIVWGDGKTSTGTIVPFGSGWRVVGSHSYLKKARYVITVQIKDVGGAIASATTNVNVGPVK